jgi:hypothetical protein
MKKILAVFFVAMMLLSVVTGCSKIKEAYRGFGLSQLLRLGPGKDNTETQVYSINQVFADVIFDQDGKIVYVLIDQVEVATPNYDGEGMPHFSGFPGQIAYNADTNHDEVVDAQVPVTNESYLAEVAGWVTKRERGEGYKMNTGTWASQMDAYQTLFVGKTVEEIKTWFTKYCSDVNGRPLKVDSTKPEDIEKYGKLTEDEKKALADVTTKATMSLNDSHGNIIEALEKAYANKTKLAVKNAVGYGVGYTSLGRVGPGKDSTDTQVYSFNQVFVSALYDKDGKIVDIFIDQLEVATPNYDGASMPHFSGFTGMGGYSLDENHDEIVDGKTVVTDEFTKSEIAGWVTKRERGEEYKMTTGSWLSQMDGFQKLFIGKTVAEVQDWFAKYCSDVNGRPLKADSTKPEDIEKYGKLTAEEKTMLADVIATSTISLKDSHGDILAAIKKSFDTKITIEKLTVK